MDKLRAMATFVAIAERGSLTAAAAALDSSLPAVVRQSLEDFEDAPRPIHIVFPHARLLPTRTRLFIDWMKDALKPFQPRPTPK